jgi:hypothetical protein
MALCLCPRLALACPTCFNATADNRLAFIVTTIFLSLMPLAFIGGGVYTLRRLTREAAARDAAAREAELG